MVILYHTSVKIDFTTLEVKHGTLTDGTQTLTGITTGKWLIWAYITVLASGTEKGLELYKGSTSIKQGYFGNNLTSVWGTIVLFDVIENTGSDTFKIKATNPSNPTTRSKWIAIRLGDATVVD